jgi:hypothetical protein
VSLTDSIARLGDDNPSLVPDLIPIMVKATGTVSCCRKATPAPDRVIRKDLIRLASRLPEGSHERRAVLAIIPR